MTWGKYAIKSHLFELVFHVSEVMFSYHQVTAHIEQDVPQSTLDAAFAHAQTVDIAMPIDRGDDNRVSASFNGSINIFVWLTITPRLMTLKSWLLKTRSRTLLPTAWQSAPITPITSVAFFMGNPL